MFVVTVGTVLGVGLWIVAIFTISNSMSNRNLDKLSPIMVDPNAAAGSSAGGSAGAAPPATGSSAPSSTGGGAPSSAGGGSGGGSGTPTGPAFANLPIPNQHPASTQLLATAMPGYAIYTSTCAACHGADLEGVIGPELRGIGNAASAAKLQQIITAGIPPLMPAMGGLTSAGDVQKVAQWLAAQKQK